MISMDKKYQTRDGREVIVHTVDGPDEDEPVVASVNNGTRWVCSTWYKNGKAVINGLDNPGDLIEVREPREIWVNEYEGSDQAHRSEKDALSGYSPNVIRKAVHFIEVLPVVDGPWRPINTFQGEDKISVLVHCSKHKNNYTAYRENGLWFHFAVGLARLTEAPTHWMPNPQAPVVDGGKAGA